MHTSQIQVVFTTKLRNIVLQEGRYAKDLILLDDFGIILQGPNPRYLLRRENATDRTPSATLTRQTTICSETPEKHTDNHFTMTTKTIGTAENNLQPVHCSNAKTAIPVPPPSSSKWNKPTDVDPSNKQIVDDSITESASLATSSA